MLKLLNKYSTHLKEERAYVNHNISGILQLVFITRLLFTQRNI